MHGIKIQKIGYGGWDNCIQLTNDMVDLVITTDIGPRIIRYGLTGQANELCEVAKDIGKKGGDDWRIYGGHRLWHSPESRPRTYVPDNSKVHWEEVPGGIKTIQDIEPVTNIRKEMEITISPDDTSVTIVHRLTNSGHWPVELAAWAITAMATGGLAVIPQTVKDTGLLPNRVISLWPYSRTDDPRLRLGERYITIKQDTSTEQPFKIGTSNEDGWAGYFNNGHLFIKYYSHDPNAVYPDCGVSFESYTSDFMLELESLSPLSPIKPCSFIEHTERWELFDNIPMPSNNDSAIKTSLTGRIAG